LIGEKTESGSGYAEGCGVDVDNAVCAPEYPGRGIVSFLNGLLFGILLA
jgi:hypothetical protein